MKTPDIRVLYVDDEENNLISFKSTFGRHFIVYTAESAEQAETILANNEIHIICSDQRMPRQTGIEFFEQVKKNNPDTIRILITGFSDINAVKDAINRGHVYAYREKPWDGEELVALMNEAYEVYSLRKKEKQLLKLVEEEGFSIDEIQELKEVNKRLETLLRRSFT